MSYGGRRDEATIRRHRAGRQHEHEPANDVGRQRHPVNASKYYHLWLPMFYQTGLGFNGRLDGGGTQFELRFYPNGGIVASGGGTVSADVTDLLVESDIRLDMDTKSHLSVVREHV